MKSKISIVTIVFSLLLFSCGEKQIAVKQTISPLAAFDSLINYIEKNGDFINSPNVPAMISANVLYGLLDSNTLVIDTRTPEEFANAHIEHSVNVEFESILSFFENKIDPNSFKRIVLVCNAGQTASYATSILRILGYNNVFALKWGFSSWHKETANKRWLGRISNRYSEMLERNPNPQPSAGKFPEIETNESFGYAIARKRAEKLFSDGFTPITITADTLFDPKHGYFLVNYWPEPLYNKGHIPGAIRYQPKKSLKSSEQLNTLPTNKPIAVYCFTGQHSAFVTAYLRLIGYNAFTLNFGANGFMHGFMVSEGIENTFSEKEIYNLPVVSGGVTEKAKELEVVTVAPRGGC